MFFNSIFRNVNVTLLCITNTPTMLYAVSPESEVFIWGEGWGNSDPSLWIFWIRPWSTLLKAALCLDTSHVAHQARAYRGFLSMKRLRVFLLTPGWDDSLSQGYPPLCIQEWCTIPPVLAKKMGIVIPLGINQWLNSYTVYIKIDIDAVRLEIRYWLLILTLGFDRSPLLGACNFHNKPMQRHFTDQSIFR